MSPSRPAAGPSRPPPRALFGIDEDAKTQELVIKRIVSLSKSPGEVTDLSAQSTSDSATVTVVGPRPSRPPSRTTDLNALGRAMLNTQPPASRIPARSTWLQRFVSRLLAPLKRFGGRTPSPSWRRDRQGFLDGIHPKYLRAAARTERDSTAPDGAPQYIENRDWRIEVARASEGASVSFLDSAQESQAVNNFVRRRSFDSYPPDNRAKKGSKSYSKLSVSAFSKGVGTEESDRQLQGTNFSYAVFSPPRIVLKGALLRRDNVSTLILRGRAVHPLCVRDVMVFADKKKILYLSNASRDNAGYIEFSADIPLSESVSHVLVVARHNNEVMGSQSLLVKPSSKRKRPNRIRA